MKAVAIIPARLAATRLPDKPLAMIQGRTMVEWVHRRASAARNIDRVIVATPDPTIAEVVRAFGGEVALTRPDHQTGTDRIAEAAAGLPDDVSVVVNVQGDEPRVEPEVIEAVAEVLLRDTGLPMSTVCCPLPEGRESDPNVVKVVVDASGNALYFSRAGIPFRRSDDPDYLPLQHVGLYGYRRTFLETFPLLPRTPLERIESLEQLRVLEHGHRIRLIRVDRVPESVDTAEDLERVRALFAADGGLQ
ncbi:MAG: 3-deoxy-manno-octulosonate cytidylyltransferase [Armatimonadota bacterium]